MNYANTWKNGCTCYHCKQSIDGHAIPMIQSDDTTTALAKKMQQQLDSVVITAIAKGYILPKGAFMVGAAIATIGTAVIKVAALSGASAGDLLSYMPSNALGKDVVLIGNNVNLTSYVNILKESLTLQIKDVNNSVNSKPPLVIDSVYPVGTCAAQKLVDYIVKQSGPTNDKHINKINMAEIFWRASADFKSPWSTGDVVPSCNTCNYVLPMMLCNYKDGEKLPYKS